MSKKFEALEQAEREVRGMKEDSGIISPGEYLSRIPALEMEPEMMALYNSIERMLPGRPRKSIQFIASSEGEGTSTIVREFAKTAAQKLGKSVLLIDEDYRNPSHHLFFNLRPEQDWESVSGEAAPPNLLQKIGDSNLYLSLLSRNRRPAPQFFLSERFASLWASAMSRFDLIVFDSPAASVAPDGLFFISRLVNGVVLVVEAERTRWQAAQRLKENIEAGGGTILGLVFNKRRFYIPDFVYRRM